MDILTLKVGESLKHRGKVIAQVVAINRTSVVLRFESGEEVELEPAKQPERTRKPRLQMLAVLTFALVLCLASSGLGADVFSIEVAANATDETPEAVKAQARLHVVKVTTQTRAGPSFGSGVYLGDRLVLSAQHVVEGATGPMDVAFPNPDKPSTYIDLVQGTAISTDETWDQAVIKLERLPKHNPPGVTIASDNPKAGDYITFVGYPGGGRLTMNRGQFSRYRSRGQPTSDWFVAKAPVVGGYSGGAAFNDAGEVFGNLHRSDRVSYTAAVCTGRTQRFLFPWNAQLAAWKLAVATGNAKPMEFRVCPNCNPAPSHGGIPVPPPDNTQSPTTKDCECDWAEWQKGIDDLKARIDDMASQQPSPPAEVDYERIIREVISVVKSDPEFRGPKGDKGDPGEKGDKGEPGEQGEPPPVPEPPADTDANTRRLIYFTMRDCPGCAKTDKQAKVLKDKGYPITTVTLEPKDAKVTDVPRLFIIRESRTLRGESAIVTHFAQITF